MKKAAKFTPEETAHIETLVRRAGWVDRRKAAAEVNHSGAQHDQKEFAALVWVLGKIGVAYVEGTKAADTEMETPPRRPEYSEQWRPSARSDASPMPMPRGSRYYPNGSL
jgi:hypothetical protein